MRAGVSVGPVNSPSARVQLRATDAGTAGDAALSNLFKELWELMILSSHPSRGIGNKFYFSI